MTTADCEFSLEESFRFCERLTRKEARNFYYGLRLLPLEKRRALYALYAWMRLSDDLADDEGLSEQERRATLKAWAQESARELGFAQAPPAQTRDFQDKKIWPALRWARQHFELPDEHFQALMQGLEMDMEAERRYADWPDLELYCYRVASVVGLLCMHIFGLTEGVRASEAEAAAIALGQAFQLTNILRDVGEDALRGRIYIPLTALTEEGISPEEILARHPEPAAFQRLLRRCADRAEAHYQAGRKLLDWVSVDARPALETLISIYQKLLSALRREGFPVLKRRVSLSSWTKTRLAVKGLWQQWRAGP